MSLTEISMSVQIDIFTKDIIVFPINKGNVHWLCGAINFKDKRFECYDSMNPNGHQEVYEVGPAQRDYAVRLVQRC